VLGLEKLQCLVIGNDVNVSTNQLVFPFEEGLQYGNGFMLKGTVVPLSIGKLLGQETCGSAILPLRALSVHCSNPKD
jgi:hypothetical protein